MSKIFIVICVAVISIVLVVILFEQRKQVCLVKKGEFIKANLPESYGPDSYDRRVEDTKKTIEFYDACLYPWK